MQIPAQKVFVGLVVVIVLVATSCGPSESTDARSPRIDVENDGVPTVSTSEPQDVATEIEGAPEASSTMPQNDGPASTEATSVAPPPEMPDLVGRTVADANRILADLGYDQPAITERESLEPTGTILTQVPTGGRPITGTISVIVAVPIMPMPDFVDGSLSEAEDWAQERGLEIATEAELTADVAAGTVLDQLPVAGTQPGAQILLTVAEEPVLLDLANYPYVDRSRFSSSKEINMNGGLFPSTPVFELSRAGSSAYVDFDLGRDWQVLRTQLGVTDQGSIDSVVIVEFIADGKTIATETVSFGSLTEVELDVENVLRLRITAQNVSGRISQTGMGNAVLIGGAAEPTG